MEMMKRPLAAAVALVALSTLALAAARADQGMAHAEHGAAGQDDSAAVKAYRAANDRMHQAMTTSYSGDADVDFARGMIPHHQGAIEMAKIELEHGSDPQMRILAEQIINAQQAEIETLRRWLEAHDKGQKAQP